MTKQSSSPRLRPVIRVFVSSTFSDMRHERNALQERVYSKLEQLCQKNGFQFQAIDLRWGVSTEAGLDHRAMRICFEELRRSQEISPEPNFLVLLGDRYGWRPLPEEISKGEFDRLVTAADSGGTGQSPISGTHGKTARQVLEEWYRCDENVLLSDPPETTPDRAPLNYILQPRTQTLGDGRDYTRTKDDPPKDTQDWLDVQQVLWRIINAAFPAEALDHRFENINWSRHAAEVCDSEHPKRAIPQFARFQASATEQEIWGGALSAPNAERHVLAFFREIENGDKFSPVDVKEFFDRTDAGDLDKAAAARQTALKAAIRLRLGADAVGPIPFSRLKHENGKVLVAASPQDTEQFCKSVEDRLRPIIERQIDQYWHPPQHASVERTVRELEIEQQEHARIAQERGGAKTFVGRADKLAAIHDYLLNDSTSPLVVHGTSGCGKTALMARASELSTVHRSLSTVHRSLSPTILTRFLGTTPRSSDLRGLLTSLCQELRQRYPREGELPTDIKLLEVELQEQFKAATAEQPLILFLDALDQLADTDGGRLLHWLPVGPLHAHVKIVVSCLSDRAKDPAGQPWIELQRRQLPAGSLVDLNELSEQDARTLLFERWLPQAGRTVSPDQRCRIEQRLKSEQCRQPIYLKLLFEEARLWRSYDAAPNLGEDVPALLNQLFDRLSRPTNHGELLVKRVLGYLAASREGLAEDEILEILFRDHEYKAALDQATEDTRHEMPPNATRIPIAIWSRLRFDLASYLTERAATGANVLTFYHRQVAEWVQEHFARAPNQRWQPHPLLADYFTTCARGTDPQKEWETDSVRGFAECVFHLTKAGQYDRAASLLSNFPFLLHKLRVGLLEGLFEDYEMVRREAPPEVARGLQIWADFFREKGHILRRGNEKWLPYKILLQLAVEHADNSLVTIGAEQWLSSNLDNWLWLRRVPRPPQTPETACFTVCEGHTNVVNGVLELEDGRLLSCSDDSTLRIWHAHSGKCLKTFEGHTSSVNGILPLGNGRLLSWSSDSTLRLWDSDSGVCLKILEGHIRGIWGAHELADGRLLSWSFDNTLRLWNPNTGACLRVFEGHTELVQGARILTDGRILSWSKDTTLRLWDCESGTCLKVLKDTCSVFDAHEVACLPARMAWMDRHEQDQLRDAWKNIQAGRSQAGVACLCGLPPNEPVVINARAACLMADGNAQSALELLRQLVCTNDRLTMDTEADPAWCANFCIALLRTGRRDGFISYVPQLSPQDHPAVRALQDVIGLWKTQRSRKGWIRQVLEGSQYLALPAGFPVSWPETLFATEIRSARIVDCPEAREEKRIVSCTRFDVPSYNRLRLWDCQTGEFICTLDDGSGVFGSLVLTDRRLLSWSEDSILRVWDARKGVCLKMFKGHTNAVWGATELSNGHVLSWSKDNTLRLWDAHNGACLRIFRGHSSGVRGAKELADGQLLSWSLDATLRLWDSQSGGCLKIFTGHTSIIGDVTELGNGRLLSYAADRNLRLWDVHKGTYHIQGLAGHSHGVEDTLALTDGRVLSWSGDSMRVWDIYSGMCLKVFEGQISDISNVIELHDGRLLSWSRWAKREALRLWDSKTGKCLKVFRGFSKQIEGALELADGRLLAWSTKWGEWGLQYEEVSLWDTLRSDCLETLSVEDVVQSHPEWISEMNLARLCDPEWIIGNFGVKASTRDASTRTSYLEYRVRPVVVAAMWCAESDATARYLFPDGTAVVTQENGQVCFLKLHYGNRRISLAEAEAFLVSQMRKESSP